MPVATSELLNSAAVVVEEATNNNKSNGGTPVPHMDTCIVHLFARTNAKDPKPLPSIGFIRVFKRMTLHHVREAISEQLPVPDNLFSFSSSSSSSSSDSSSWESFLQTHPYKLMLHGKIPVTEQQENTELVRDHPDLILDFCLNATNTASNNNNSNNSKTAAKTPTSGLAKKNDGDGNNKEGKVTLEPLDRSKLPFDIVTKPRKSCYTGKVIGHDICLRFDNSDKSPSKTLVGALRQITNKSVFYDSHPQITQDSLLFYIPKIKSYMANNGLDESSFMGPVVRYLDEEFGDRIQSIKAMIANGKISFPFLWYLFPFESKFMAILDGEKVGSTVNEVQYHSTFFGDSFEVQGMFIKSTGRELKSTLERFSIKEFDGLKDINELPVQPMDAATEEFLTERGKTFRSIAVGNHYMRYTGNIIYREWWSTHRYNADGRVMIDGASFSRFNPNYKCNFNSERNSSDEGVDPEKILSALSIEKLYMTWPTVTGFSFVAKKWGELHVRFIQPIRFDDEAFDQLVLVESKKQLIKSLVTHSESAFSDIISGKSGGAIFLLHGPPGVGKTLTAEAISEYLHRPLYSISVGELGVTCQQLEKKLSEILEMASTWRAVILIDEADIFLERRSDNDIERNALVGIFLRLLEYHQGILFLTTNRVKTFDEAFHSRVSVALKYAPLDSSARAAVWRNLLAAAKIQKPENEKKEGGLDVDELSKYELNGRQIKTTIRLAQTLAMSEGVAVNADHVARCVNIARQFQLDLTNDHKYDSL